MVKREPRAGCILINSEGKLLVVHNICSDYWGFPKGGKREHETHMQAAMRELREETGKRIDEKSIITSLSSNKSKLFIAAGDFSPRCRVDMREIDEYAWVNLSELKNLKTSKFTQSFFKKIEVFMQQSLQYAHSSLDGSDKIPTAKRTCERSPNDSCVIINITH